MGISIWSCLLPGYILEEFCWKFVFTKFFSENFGCVFQCKTLYWTYLRNGWSNWWETKKKFIGWILAKLCDLYLWPHTWPWPLIFQSKISKYLYLRNWYLIDVKQIETKSIRCWADHMVLTFGHTHDLDLAVSRSKFEITLFEEWKGWLTWNKRHASGSLMTMTVTYG